MRSNLSGGPETRKARFAAVLAVLAAASLLVAGCVAPLAVEPPGGPRAPGAPAAPVAATAMASSGRSTTSLSDSSASASPVGSGCVGQTLLEDHQDLPTGGTGGTSFHLIRPCRLQAKLTLNVAAGNVRVLVDGPVGVVFDEHATAVIVPTVNVWYGSRDGQSGVQPPGEYRYAFEVQGAADFDFRVTAVP